MGESQPGIIPLISIIVGVLTFALTLGTAISRRRTAFRASLDERYFRREDAGRLVARVVRLEEHAGLKPGPDSYPTRTENG